MRPLLFAFSLEWERLGLFAHHCLLFGTLRLPLAVLTLGGIALEIVLFRCFTGHFLSLPIF